MRLLRRRGPAPEACTCRLCHPDPVVAPGDRKALADVQEHGVHVLLVSDAVPCSCGHEGEHDHEPSDEPDFAYTVGLWHHRRHPELLLSGLPRHEVMHRTLNDLARVVLDGAVLRPGDVVEDALAGVAVTLEELTPEARAERVTWSSWFHRRDVPALQVVWPDTEGVFAWQGGPAVLDERQPPSWRVPGPRTGALAPEPDWPFPVPPDHLTICCRHVLEGEAAALYLQRDRDEGRGEDWCVSCGEQEHAQEDLLLGHLRHLVVRSPGLREVADLGLDEWARREDARSSWQRFRE